MSLSNFHPITVSYLIYLPSIIKSVAWVTFQLAGGSVASWSLYGTLALTCHLCFNTFPIKQDEVGPRLSQVGTSDFNHVSNYNDNGAAAIFSAALPTFNISGGKGRRPLSNESPPMRGSRALSWNEMNPLPIIVAGERVGVRRVITLRSFPRHSIPAHYSPCGAAAARSAGFIRGHGEVFCGSRLSVCATLKTTQACGTRHPERARWREKRPTCCHENCRAGASGGISLTLLPPNGRMLKKWKNVRD